MPLSLKKLLNLGCRGLAMGARFLLILYLGKFFDVEELGTFGIINTSIILAYLLIGFDFYSFATREILKVDQNSQANVVFNQAIFYFLSFLIFLPFILYILLACDVFEEAYIFPFLLLLFNEHLGQELFRLFTALQKPLTANIIFFIRTGSWILLFLSLQYSGVLSKEHFDLYTLLLFWLSGSAFSNFLGVIIVYKQFSWKNLTISFTWIKSGIKVSLWFFAATVAYKIIEYSNRYIIDFFHGKEAVGYYTFFHQIASLVNIVVFTLIIMQLFPKLIIVAKENNNKSFDSVYKEFSKSIVSWTLFCSAVVCILIYPILIYLGKEAYFENLAIFWWLVLSNLLLNLSLAPHYALYAKQRDKQLLFSTLAGTLFNLLANFLLIPFYGPTGAAVAMTIGYLFVFILKLQIKKKTFSNG
jgi:O-antigen/teichoic acid export membrane protein